MASATSIQVQFTPKNANNTLAGTAVKGLLFPRTIDGTNDLTFDGRLSYDFFGHEYNFTMIDGRGFVTVEDVRTRQLLRNDCLKASNTPPVHLFVDALREARVVDDAEALGVSSVSCADGKLVEFTFAGESYVFCSRANGAIAKVHGEDIEATVQLLRDNTADAPSVLSLLRPAGKLIEECALLVDASTATTTTTVKRALNKVNKRTQDVMQVLSGERRMASSDNCATTCRGGKKVCLFVHGLGKSVDSTVADSYPDAFGDAQTKVNCCSQTKFIRMDTVNNPWHGETLAKKVCDAAVTLSGSPDPMNLENIAIIAHSMGNLVVANAAMRQMCAIGSTSKWIALSGPMSGSKSANLGVDVCVNDPTLLDDPLIAILNAVQVCPSKDTIKSIVYEQSNLANAGLNSLFAQADAAFGKYATNVMCGVDSTGLLSFDSVRYAALDLISGHATGANDGAVEFASCRGPIAASAFTTSWNGGKYYRAAVNHEDVTLSNGDGWWGNDRKPVKWFNCQF